jgi:hypothetical protein
MSQLVNMVIGNATLYYGTFDDTNMQTLVASLTDADKLGLGKDSIKFAAKPKISDYDFAGKEDRKVMNMEEITGWDISVDGSCIDFNEKVLTASLMTKSTSAEGDTYAVYTPQSSLSTASYKDLVVVGRLKNNAQPVAVLVKNTYNADGIQFECKDKNNAAIKFSFEAAYSMDALSEVPFKIITPKTAADLVG